MLTAKQIETAMPRTAFIVTKPLQFMIAASIIDQLGLADAADLLVTNTFADAEAFAARYHKLGPRWGRIRVLPDIPDAYEYARKERAYERLFIDADPGGRKAIQLLRFKAANPSASIMVYEEGEGTYRNDLYTSPKREILHYAGVGATLGGSKLSDGIFVYEPAEYRERVGRFGGTTFQIEPSLRIFMTLNYSQLTDLFTVPEIKTEGGMACNLYLSNWDVDVDKITELARLPGQFFFKPHPHIKLPPQVHDGVKVLPSGVPVELVVIAMLDKFERVNIYHHGSSVQRYLADDRIKCMRVTPITSPVVPPVPIGRLSANW